MKDKDLHNLSRLAKKTGKHTPKEEMNQPENSPSKKELERTYKLNLKTLKIDLN